MLLTKKRLHRIKKSKYQSRKKYQKGGKKKRRKRKRKRSFRKRRKALNLRRKSLKNYNQRGGTRDELIMLVPTIHPEHPTKVSALMFIKTKDPVIKNRMISAFIQGRDIEFRRFVFKILEGDIYDDTKNMGLRGGKYIRLPEGQHLNVDDKKDVEYLVKLNLTLLGIQRKNPQLTSNEIESRIAILARQPVVSKKLDNESKKIEPVKSDEFPSASVANIVTAKVAAKKLKSGLRHDMFSDETDETDGDILTGDRCAVSKLMNPDGTTKDFPCYPLQKMRDDALAGQLNASRNPDCLGAAKQLSDKQASCKYDDSGKLVVEEEYEDDFEDPCEGVNCEPGEKCVDGDCKDDDYSDDTFEQDNTGIGGDLIPVPGAKKFTEPVDVMCANHGQCPPEKPKCLNGSCVTQDDFTTAKKAEGAAVRNLRESSRSSNEGDDDTDLSGFFAEPGLGDEKDSGTKDEGGEEKTVSNTQYSELLENLEIAILNLMMSDDDVNQAIIQEAINAIKDPNYPDREAVIARGQELLNTLGPQTITISEGTYEPGDMPSISGETGESTDTGKKNQDPTDTIDNLPLVPGEVSPGKKGETDIGGEDPYAHKNQGDRKDTDPDDPSTVIDSGKRDPTIVPGENKDGGATPVVVSDGKNRGDPTIPIAPIGDTNDESDGNNAISLKDEQGDPSIPIPSNNTDVDDDTISETKGETSDPLNLTPGDVLQVAIYNGPRWNADDPEKYNKLWENVDRLRNQDYEDRKNMFPDSGKENAPGLNIAPTSRYDWKDIHRSIIGFPIKRESFLTKYQTASSLLYTLVNVKFVRFENGKYYVEPLNPDEIKFPRTFGDPDDINNKFFSESGGPKETLNADEIISVNGDPLGESSTTDGDTKIHDDDLPNVPENVPSKGDGGDVPNVVPGDVPGGVPGSGPSGVNDPTGGISKGDVSPGVPSNVPGGVPGGSSNLGNLPNPQGPQVIPSTGPSAPPVPGAIGQGGLGPGASVPGSTPVPIDFGGQNVGTKGSDTRGGPGGGSPSGATPRGNAPGTDAGAPVVGKNDPIRYHQPWIQVRGQVFPGPYQPGFRVTADTGVNFTSWLRHLGQPNPTASGPSSFTNDGGGGGGGGSDTKSNTFNQQQSFKSTGDTKVMAEPLPEAVAQEIPDAENPDIQHLQTQKSESPDQSSVDSTDTKKEGESAESSDSSGKDNVDVDSDTKKQEEQVEDSDDSKKEVDTDSEWGPLPPGVGGDIPDRNEPVWKKIEGDEVPAGSEVVMGLQTGEKYIKKPSTSQEQEAQEEDKKQELNADLSEEAKKGAAASAEEASKKLAETMKQIEEIANCRAKSMAIEPSTCPTKRSDYLKMLRNLAVDKAYNSACKDHAGEKLEYFRETCKKPAADSSEQSTEEKVPVTPSNTDSKKTEVPGSTDGTGESKGPRVDSQRGGTRKKKSRGRKKKSKRRSRKKSTKHQR